MFMPKEKAIETLRGPGQQRPLKSPGEANLQCPKGPGKHLVGKFTDMELTLHD